MVCSFDKNSQLGFWWLKGIVCPKMKITLKLFQTCIHFFCWTQDVLKNMDNRPLLQFFNGSEQYLFRPVGGTVQSEDFNKPLLIQRAGEVIIRFSKIDNLCLTSILNNCAQFLIVRTAKCKISCSDPATFITYFYTVYHGWQSSVRLW